MSDSEIPDLCNDSSGDEWDEAEEEEEAATCLFCDRTSKSMVEAIDHVEKDHGLRLQELQIRFNMDQYNFIKMVNYIRTHNSKPEEIQAATVCEWNDEKYLKPVSGETHVEWLMFDFEEHFNAETAKKATGSSPLIIEISQLELNEMRSHQRQMEDEVKLLRDLLDEAQKRLQGNLEKVLTELEEQQVDEEKEQKPKNCVASVKVADDEMYFSSYAHYDIHHEMLSDVVRTRSYQEAILQNSEYLKGKTVLDLGCGSGVLSMFCSKAGAEQVYSIDQSEIIYKAMDICRANGFENVNLIKGRLEDTELPVEKVDVIVSEWMGYFLLFEGMMDSVIYARDRHLKEGGKLLPNRCNMSLVAFGDEARHKELIGFWDDVYGINMECMKPEVLKDAVIEVCNPKWILSEANVIADIDLVTATTESCNFKYDFKLRIVKEGRLTSFVGYFDTFFELPHSVSFSTGPEVTPTHWKQTVFYLKDPVEVTVGQVVEGRLKCRRHRKEVRSLSVTIEVFGQKNKYTIN